MSAKVIRDPSTLIQIRDGSDRSVAQIKLFNPDHIAVIEGLVEIVAPDAVDAIMTLIRAKASKEFL